MKMFLANLARRSPIEWGSRILLAAAVGVVGYFAVISSLAETLPSRAIEQAHGLTPWNARIAAKLSYRQITADAAALSGRPPIADAARIRMAEAEALAVSALRRDGTAITAITALGMAAQLQGDVEAARRWFAYSERLSRRDYTTQLWLIEDAVQRDDIAGALRHYDIALRTKRAAPDVLFPVLAAASTEPEIAAELVKSLRAQPAWTPFFISYLAANSPDPEATARLFIALRRAAVPVPEDASATLVNILLAGHEYTAAWNYYATVRPGVDRHASRDPDFAAMSGAPSYLDWIPADTATGVSASIQPGREGGVFDFSTPPSVGGPLLQQVQLLPSGRYVLEGLSVAIDQPPGARPYWILKCGSDDRQLGSVEVPNSAENNGRFAGSITIPPNCPSQILILMARASDELGGVSGQIDHVQLRLAK